MPAAPAALPPLDDLAEVPLQGLIVIHAGPVEQRDEIAASSRVSWCIRGGLPV